MVELGGLRIHLLSTSEPRGLLGWSLQGLLPGAAAAELLPGVVTVPPSHVVNDAASQTPLDARKEHPNTVLWLGELLLHVPDVRATVAGLAAAGLQTKGSKPPREMGSMLSAVYFLGGMRVLLTGPKEPKG